VVGFFLKVYEMSILRYRNASRLFELWNDALE
jgi:hypothetical protein